MDSEVESNVRDRMARLQNSPGADPEVVAALLDWITASTFLARLRMNVHVIAKEIGIDIDRVTTECVRAAHMGILDMFWTAHCQHCNMISVECVAMNHLSSTSFCSMCEAETEGDLRDTVEVTFALPQEVEATRINPGCCAPKALRPKYQMTASKGHCNEVTDTIEEGVYRFYCPLTLAVGKLQVSGEPYPFSDPSPCSEPAQLLEIRQLVGPHFASDYLTCRPGPLTIRLHNDGEFNVSGLNVHLDAIRDVKLTAQMLDAPRLSGLDLVHLPVFQELFGTDVLSRRSPLAVCSVTFLFMDVTESTALYEALGDMRAFLAVQRVFERCAAAVTHHGGRVVKTIGDSIMASFVSPTAGLSAAVSMVQACAELKAEAEAAAGPGTGIEIKVGLHTGPVVMATCNGILDYFGATVNRACRVESLCPSMRVAASAAVFASAREVLEEEAWAVEEASVELKGVAGQHAVYLLSPLAGWLHRPRGPDRAALTLRRSHSAKPAPRPAAKPAPQPGKLLPTPSASSQCSTARDASQGEETTRSRSPEDTDANDAHAGRGAAAAASRELTRKALPTLMPARRASSLVDLLCSGTRSTRLPSSPLPVPGPPHLAPERALSSCT